MAKVGLSPQPQAAFGDDSPVLLSTVLLRVRKLITRGVSEGVLVGTVLAAILIGLLGSCLFMSFLPTRH